MTSVRKSYISKSFQKIENYYLLKSLKISWLLTKNLKQSYYHLYQQTVLLKIIYIKTLESKFLLWLNGILFDFKKTSFRCYGFSVVINVWLAHLVSRFACNTRVVVDASSCPPVFLMSNSSNNTLNQINKQTNLNQYHIINQSNSNSIRW